MNFKELLPLYVMGFLFLSFIIKSTVKILKEYERGVLFRLGRYIGTKGPGLVIVIPVVDQLIPVDLRIVTMDVPTQEVITRDNVTIKVNAVVYFKVVEPDKAIIRVENFVHATSQFAQTTLRSILGQSELDEILARRENINVQLQEIIDEATDGWGIKVTAVEIKDVELPQSMQRAMAKQAEAEREKRAKVIHAEGEEKAAENLLKAAREMSQEPGAMQLRYLQTLTEISVEKSSTILFPVPIDTIKSFLDVRDRTFEQPQLPKVIINEPEKKEPKEPKE